MSNGSRRTRPNAVILNGRTKSLVRSSLERRLGSIINISGKEGRMVEVDEIIARQNIKDRNALLAEASALVKQREIEFVAAQKLAQRVQIGHQAGGGPCPARRRPCPSQNNTLTLSNYHHRARWRAFLKCYMKKATS